MLLVPSFVLLLLHVYQKKNMKAHEWLASSVFRLLFLHYHISPMQLPANSAFFHFHLFSIVVFFCSPDLSTECCYLFIVIYLNARARYLKTEVGRERRRRNCPVTLHAKHKQPSLVLCYTLCSEITALHFIYMADASVHWILDVIERCMTIEIVTALWTIRLRTTIFSLLKIT